MRCSRRGPTRGVSILEMLVVLAALALVAVVFTSGRNFDDDPLANDRELAELAERLQNARAQAVEMDMQIELTNFATPCSGINATLLVHPDGTASGGPFCLISGRIMIDPLTARMMPESGS